MSGDLAPVLREAVRTGDYAPVGALLADGAVLRSSSERGRRTVTGRDAVVAHLSAPGPGEILDWDAREWPAGAALTFEWEGAGGRDRRRWYVRRGGDGRVAEWWSYAARPKAGAGGGDGAVPEAVLARVGSGARRVPLLHAGNSGAALERVVLADGTALVAKRVAPGADWLGRATRDEGRTALLWEAGAFSRMPDEIVHGIVAVEREEGGAAWVLMRDVSPSLLGDERRLSREESRGVLDAAAALHRAFAGAVPPGAAALRDRLAMSAPSVADAERDGPDLLPKQFEAAWEAFAEVVDDDVATEILRAVDDAGPLAAALGEPTLVHGDLRDDNLGFEDGRVVLLDWDLAAGGPPAVDFAWYLCHDAWRIDATHDEIEADFRAAEGDLDERETELGIASGLVQYGWIFGHSARIHPDPEETAWAREELAWWVPRVRRALERTGGLP